MKWCLWIVVLLGGCGPKDESVESCTPQFGCKSNQLCLKSPKSTMLYCATGDQECPSTLRWSRTSGDDLAGECVQPTGEGLSVSPSNHNFGLVPLGVPASVTFTVTNGGTIEQRITQFGLNAALPNSFMVVSETCSNALVAPTRSCEAVVSFVYAEQGAASAELTVNGVAVATMTGTRVATSALALTPASHNFGDVAVGVSTPTTFTLTNNGSQSTGTISVTTTGGFALGTNQCVGMTLAPGASCLIAVDFAPVQSGMRGGELRVLASPGGSARATLMGNGLTNADIASIAPSAPSFGTVLIGQSSSPVRFTISNLGDVASGNVTLDSTGATGSWTLANDNCLGRSIPGGGMCTIDAIFQPTFPAGSQSMTLTFSATPGGTARAILGGTALAPAGLSSAPGTIVFAATGVLATREETTTISNEGGQNTGRLQLAALGGNASDFAIVSTGGNDCVHNVTILVPEASCILRVRFTPSATGNRQTDINVSASPGGVLGTVAVGMGITPANLMVSSSTLSFGSAAMGQVVDRNFTVLNLGAATSGVIDLQISGEGVGYFAQFTQVSADCNNGMTALAGNASCTVRVRFTAPDTLPHTATLTVSAVPGGSRPVTLTAN